jgi:CrcB protein
MRFVWIGAAGAIGAVARYAVGLAFSSTRFPWGTLSVNIIGSLALGFVFSWGLERWPVSVSTPIAVGLIGGFTTFSTFSVQIVLEVDGGRTDKAALYLAASVLGGVAAAAAGYILGRRLA